jgi:hypothetical protein
MNKISFSSAVGNLLNPQANPQANPQTLASLNCNTEFEKSLLVEKTSITAVSNLVSDIQVKNTYPTPADITKTANANQFSLNGEKFSVLPACWGDARGGRLGEFTISNVDSDKKTQAIKVTADGQAQYTGFTGDETAKVKELIRRANAMAKQPGSVATPAPPLPSAVTPAAPKTTPAPQKAPPTKPAVDNSI